MVRWNFMRKRGQAAMEFLMTYGWAILVVLAAIGALAYFGVLSPDRFLPDKCTASPPFACTQWKIATAGAGQVQVFLQNSGGTDVQGLTVALSCNDGSAASAVAGAPTTLANGNTGNFTYTCAAGAPVTGQRWRGNFTITYTKTGESVSHQTTGAIQVRAE
jgi:hypothetical protein